MEKMNQTSVTEFILLGLTDDPKLQVPLFFLFFLNYTFTIVCNVSIGILIFTVPQLHSPMYFFLCNLSISDFCSSSVIAPKMLKDLLSEKKSISFAGCAAQTFFFSMFGAFGGHMLSAMAYDRYAAICHPLLYHLIINRSVCILLVTGVYLSGIMSASAYTSCTFSVSFCGSNVINNFFCDTPALIELSTSDRFDAEIVLLAVTLFFALGCISIIVASYIYIVSAILKIPSTAGKRKTFSTCGSHLTCLSLLYVTGLFNYLSLRGNGSTTMNKVMSVCYTLAPPLLNPLIYSLRNQQMKGAILTVMHKRCYYNKMIVSKWF